MKITVERGTLLKSLGRVQGIVERRNTIPILSHMLLLAKDGRLSITATDLDIEIMESLVVDMATEGVATVPAHIFYDVVRKLPEGAQVELNYNNKEGRIDLVAGRSRFMLQSLPKDDFPAAADNTLPCSFVLPATSLSRLIQKTRTAISTDETRYYLNGVYLHSTEGKVGPVLRAVATDGHRLARVDLPLPEGAADMPGVILPRKTAMELQKMMEGITAEVSISLSNTRIRFEFDDVVLTSKLIDGKFPDYERVIPEGNDKSMSVSAAVFSDTVDRVAIILSEKSRSVKLSMEQGHLTLSASSPESGSAIEELGVAYEGGPLEIGFNAGYLMDITGQFQGDMACFELADSGSPTIIRDSEDDTVLYVLMPMRV
ncbi:MAG: DNA polymerase III subunit beta [Parvularculales bacterium]